jgi:hypothetical protein
LPRPWFNDKKQHKPDRIGAEMSEGLASPIIVLGMHRSGTSLLANILNASGVFLGEDRELMPPNSGNPDGYFENQKIVTINDRILESAGAAWDYLTPLQTSPDWLETAWSLVSREASDVLSDLAANASAAQRRWGWKDPRTCLTYPFWTRLCERPKVVVSLRDPLAVAQSLARRNFISVQLGLSLTDAYLRGIVRATANVDALFVQYESLITEPQAVLPGLLEFVAPGTSLSLQRLGLLVNSNLVHHGADLSASAYARQHESLISCYVGLQKKVAVPQRRPVVVEEQPKAPVAYRTPLDLGPVQLAGRMQGIYPDRWVGPMFQAIMTATRDLETLAMEIWAPASAPDSPPMEVVLRLNDQITRLTLHPSQRTHARLRCSIPRDSPIYLEMQTPFLVTGEKDKRRLSYIIRALQFS